MQFVKLNILSSLLFILGALVPLSAYAQQNQNTSTNSVLDRLTKIDKQLEESKKRDEEILANQKKIIEEVKKAQIWARR